MPTPTNRLIATALSVGMSVCCQSVGYGFWRRPTPVIMFLMVRAFSDSTLQGDTMLWDDMPLNSSSTLQCDT